MAVKRAMLEIESTGQPAWFEAEVKLPSDEIVGPALVVEVVDFTEALELVETLNRSRAQKKREKKTTNVESEDEPGANRIERPPPTPMPPPPPAKGAA